MAAAPDEPEVMKGTAIGGWMWVSLCSTYPISEVQLKLNKKEWRKKLKTKNDDVAVIDRLDWKMVYKLKRILK